MEPRASDRIGPKGPVAYLRVTASNQGDKTVERVHLEVSLNGPFHFMAPEHFQELRDDFLQPPEVPAPYDPALNLSHLARGDLRRPDVFYVQDAAIQGKKTKCSPGDARS